MSEELIKLIKRYKKELKDTAFYFDVIAREIEEEDYASARHHVDLVFTRLSTINRFLTSLRSALFRIQEELTREIKADKKGGREVRLRHKEFLLDEVREICVNTCGSILSPQHVFQEFHKPPPKK